MAAHRYGNICRPTGDLVQQLSDYKSESSYQKYTYISLFPTKNTNESRQPADKVPFWVTHIFLSGRLQSKLFADILLRRENVMV